MSGLRYLLVFSSLLAGAPRLEAAEPPRTGAGAAGKAQAGKVSPPAPHATPPPVKAAPPASGAPDGFVEVKVEGIVPIDDNQAVILSHAETHTFLPIWIGPAEASAIQLRLERRRFERPLTHDLLDALVRALGGELVKVHVDDLKGNTFVATLFVRRGDRLLEIDARPSDSIVLAVGNRIPVFVSRRVLERAGQKPGDKKPPASAPPPSSDDPGAIQTL